MKASEHALQVSVAHMLTITLDPAHTWWSAIDHGAGKMSKMAAGMMKARGVKRGLPDFIIMARRSFMFGIELKSESGRLTPDQMIVGDVWLGFGFPVYLARSLEDVHDILIETETPMRRHLKFFGGAHERDKRSRAPGHRRARRTGQPEDHLSVVQQHPEKEN